LRYGFSSSITIRTKEDYPEAGYDGYSYRELLRLGVFHSYEFASNIKWAEESYGRYYTTGYFDKGLGPLDLELEIYFTPYVSSRFISSLDGRIGKFTSHDLSLDIKDHRGDSLSIVYDFENPTRKYGPPQSTNVNQIRGDLTINMGKGFSGTYSARYDLDLQDSLETYISLNYMAQCYSFRLMWEDTNDQRRIAFLLDLFGLGSFGNTASKLVNTYDTGMTY
jgi:hypothetical protein